MAEDTTKHGEQVLAAYMDADEKTHHTVAIARPLPTYTPAGTATDVNLTKVAGSSTGLANTGVVGAGTQRVTLATDVALPAGTNLLGKVGIDQTTPGTTNGVTTRDSATVAVSLTRTADTNAYAANDCVGAATGSTAALTFTAMGPASGRIIITSISFECYLAAVISGMTTWRLHLYSVTPPSAYGDNVAWDILTGDRASYLGFLELGTLVDLGGTLHVQTTQVNRMLQLAASGNLFGYLVTVGAYTPSSADIFRITLHAVTV